MENDIPLNHPHHVKLYILLAVVVIGAILFFLFLPQDQITQTAPGEKPVSLEARITLSSAEAAAKDELLSDPDLTQRVTYTSTQTATKKKVLDDPELSRKKTIKEI